MRNIKKFSELNESVSTTTDLLAVEKMAKAQNYAFIKSEKKGLAFELMVNNVEYNVTIYEGGRFGVIKKSPKKDEIKGDWFTSAWGVSFNYIDKKGNKTSSVSIGLNSIDAAIGWGVLGLIEYNAKIKSSGGSFVPILAKYTPATEKCINPKNLKEITSGKCILTIGSRGDIVKMVQSSLNFVLSKDMLSLLSGSIYSSEAISSMKEVNIEPDGKFGKITEEGVKEFQKLVGGMAVDGIIGKNTLTNLIKAKEEILEKEKESLESEMKKIEEIPAEEIKDTDTSSDSMDSTASDSDIDTLPAIDTQIEIEKTLKELRKEKRDSRRKRRLLRRLARLQKRENRVKDKIEKLSESSLNFLTDYDTYLN